MTRTLAVKGSLARNRPAASLRTRKHVPCRYRGGLKFIYFNIGGDTEEDVDT